MKSHRWTTPLILTLLAVLIQAAALAAIGSLRGSPTAYAYQSPDSAEYVAFARGIAWQGRYIPLNSAGEPTDYVNTWRVPGYQAFLAIFIRLFGDSTLALLLAQQILAAATVPVLYILIRRFADARWAILATVIWAIDPFRLYYSQWLLAKTLFIFILLLAAYAWGSPHRHPWTYRRSALLGLLAGIAILVRPIGLLLPPLAWLGVLVTSRQQHQSRTISHRIYLALVCIAGTSAAVVPYLARNQIVADHFSLTPQSGPSFAYHKVVDVVLFSQNKSQYRFDEQTLSQIRADIDQQLQSKWQERFGPLTPKKREQLTYDKLNFGKVIGVDPFVTSSLLWSVGLEMLADRPWSTAGCFAIQGIKMLIFPLGLVLSPPAGEGSAPLSMLLGQNATAGKLIAILLGTFYAALVWIALIRLVAAVCRRSWPEHFFVIWPMLALFMLTLPFEDPRFRLPLIPFLLLLAVGRQVRHRQHTSKAASANKDPHTDLSPPEPGEDFTGDRRNLLKLFGFICFLVILVYCVVHFLFHHEEPPIPTSDEIIVAGQRFSIGAPVVTWQDAGGYNAYLEHQYFTPDKVFPDNPVDPGNPKRFSQRRMMPATLKAKVKKEGWTLDHLREQVDLLIYHYDACGTSARCFKALQDVRGLSVHFMLDLDGTIYQTLDLKERAWHAGNANCRSIGIEIANIGAYSEQRPDVIDEWYFYDEAGPYVVFPETLAPELAVLRIPKFVARPAHKQLVSGRINGRDLVQYDYTNEQYAALTKLTAALVQIFPKITLDVPRNSDGTIRMDVLSKKELNAYNGLIGHQHINKGKTDPGPAFDWERVIEGVREELNQHDQESDEP